MDQQLAADIVFSEDVFAQPCEARPGQTLVGVGLDDAIPAGRVYFLLQVQANYSYKMLEISRKRPEGCPGETEATYENPPSLFPKN